MYRNLSRRRRRRRVRRKTETIITIIIIIEKPKEKNKPMDGRQSDVSEGFIRGRVRVEGVQIY